MSQKENLTNDKHYAIVIGLTQNSYNLEKNESRDRLCPTAPLSEHTLFLYVHIPVYMYETCTDA